MCSPPPSGGFQERPAPSVLPAASAPAMMVCRRVCRLCHSRNVHLPCTHSHTPNTHPPNSTPKLIHTHGWRVVAPGCKTMLFGALLCSRRVKEHPASVCWCERFLWSPCISFTTFQPGRFPPHFLIIICPTMASVPTGGGVRGKEVGFNKNQHHPSLT